MIRIGSQLTFCSPQNIIKRTVVEQDEQNRVTSIFSLDDINVESEQTVFYDGILSAEIISIKQHTSTKDIESLVANYNYFDFSELIPDCKIAQTDKQLVLDFGTNSFDKTNRILSQIIPSLSTFSIFEIIAACTYYPASILGIKPELTENRCTKLSLWENVDLINKCLTPGTKIRQIS
ncbi:MAG: hypothetical protein P4L34_06145 [Paludibacter sp.]|nr:hypothetical protein [Paludibacter sp.]